MLTRPPGVDPVPRADEMGVDGEIRGRVPECAATLVAGDHDPVELVRAAQHPGGADDVAFCQRGADG